MHENLRRQLTDFAGEEDIKGIELSSMIRVLANFYDTAVAQKSESGEISGPRMGILLRLMAEEDTGNLVGLNPTAISQYQNVKKNTISSLLRGLEHNGLIERTLDPVDKRIFYIRITKAGRELIRMTAPGRLRLMNQLSSDLTGAEKDQLILLLEKLRKSMKCNSAFPIQHGFLPLETKLVD
ncbi:MAG: MarR family transcriptional regulator [Chloroflexi bacterium]|nr:MarR family transcriptional regulator [Chloroflexota bacterium]